MISTRALHIFELKKIEKKVEVTMKSFISGSSCTMQSYVPRDTPFKTN